MGGNACGKTTLTTAVYQRQSAWPGVRWIFADNDNEFKQPVPVQYKHLMAHYANPEYRALIVEGTRLYSTVYRVSWLSPVRRQLYAAILIQSPESMRAHLRARCVKAGKRYRAEFWDGPEGARALRYEGSLRYVNAAKAFQKAGGVFADLQVFPIGPQYEGTDTVQAWLEHTLCA
jgi:hypothetical protein